MRHCGQGRGVGVAGFWEESESELFYRFERVGVVFLGLLESKLDLELICKIRDSRFRSRSRTFNREREFFFFSHAGVPVVFLDILESELQSKKISPQS